MPTWPLPEAVSVGAAASEDAAVEADADAAAEEPPQAARERVMHNASSSANHLFNFFILIISFLFICLHRSESG